MIYMIRINRNNTILAALLLVLLVVSSVAVAAQIQFSFRERFSKNTQSSCTTCNQCQSCSSDQSFSFHKNIPSSIQDKMSVISSFKGLNITPAKTRTSNHGWNAITNPPFGCPAGKCV